MLEEKSDLELVENLKAEVEMEDSLKELKARHSGIFYKFINKYLPPDSSGPERDDLVDEMDFIFYDSSVKFDKTKSSKFSTFLGNQVVWTCLNLFNKSSRKTQKESRFTDLVLTEKQPETNPRKTIDEETVKNLSDVIESLPDERVRKIFKLRYIDPPLNKLTPWKQIGKQIGMSHQGCINLHNKAIPTIKQKIEQKHGFDNFGTY